MGLRVSLEWFRVYTAHGLNLIRDGFRGFLPICIGFLSGVEGRLENHIVD